VRLRGPWSGTLAVLPAVWGRDQLDGPETFRSASAQNRPRLRRCPARSDRPQPFSPWSDALSYLLRKEGFEVATCPTGRDALAAFDRHGADLVVLDLMLPGSPGTEVCQRLRERSSVPVIMLSAKDTEVDKAIGLELVPMTM
jgi:hypothetical protein